MLALPALAGDPVSSDASSILRFFLFIKSTEGLAAEGVAAPPIIQAFRFRPILRVNSCVICCADRCSSSFRALACCAALDSVGGREAPGFFFELRLPGATSGSSEDAGVAAVVTAADGVA